METKPTKYTEEFVLNELGNLLKEVQNNKEFFYLWQLFNDKSYSRYRYSEWIKKYSDNEEIKEISHTIKEILETRAIVWWMQFKLQPSLVKFHLQNNFNWKDKQEVINKNLDFDLDLTKLSDDELTAILNKYE